MFRFLIQRLNYFFSHKKHHNLYSADTKYIISFIQKLALNHDLVISPQAIRIKNDVIKIIISNDIKMANKTEIFHKKCIDTFPHYQINIIQEILNQTASGAVEMGLHKQKNPSATKHPIPKNIRPGEFKKIILVASGKGGVGKSSVSLNLARCLVALGYKTAFVDCDIYGPSGAIMTGGGIKPKSEKGKLYPIEREGLTIMSMGFMVESSEALVWRGPMVSSAISQIFKMTQWPETDIAIVDLPPGTGDAQLTLGQNLSPDGVIIVTQPQYVSVADAHRCSVMFEKLNVPILGVIENMSGFTLPDTQETYSIFGEGGGQEFAKQKNYPFLGKLPIVPKIAYCSDQGINPLNIDECSAFIQPLMKIAEQMMRSDNHNKGFTNNHVCDKNHIHA